MGDRWRRYHVPPSQKSPIGVGAIGVWNIAMMTGVMGGIMILHMSISCSLVGSGRRSKPSIVWVSARSGRRIGTGYPGQPVTVDNVGGLIC